MGRLEVASAKESEWPMACRLALGNVSADALDTRVARLFELVNAGTFDPSGLLLAKLDGSPVGAIAAQSLPGGSGVVLPPFGLDDEIRVALVDAATDHFHRAGTSVAHCLLAPEVAVQAAPLLARGYRQVTQIQHMLRSASILPEFAIQPPATVNFVPFSEVDGTAFAETLTRTYIGTLDLPETTVDRPAEVQLQAYRHGQPEPPNWWLAVDGETFPLGVVMLSVLSVPGAWEIGYLGLVPEFRGRGLGRILVQWAIAAAARAGIFELGLSVDIRNFPAIHVYREHFFRIYEMQDLYLLRLTGRN